MSAGHSTSRHTEVHPGDRFGRLVVISGPIRVASPTKSRPNRTVPKYQCRCDCGTVTSVGQFELASDNTRSCGCLRSEKASAGASARNLRHGLLATGTKRPPEYSVWRCIKRRCHDPANQDYPRYGGRGIVVCDRWRWSFVAFYRDMGQRPSRAHQIERVDNDGPYSPDNCRWATVKEQSVNRRTTVFLSHNGERLTQTEWAERTGIKASTICYRLKAGWSVADALTKPPNRR